jgi:hypothetical protein
MCAIAFRPSCCGYRARNVAIRRAPSSRRRRFIRKSRHVSTRREAVARELKALERDRMIERRRGALVLVDVDRLRRLINEAVDSG